MSFDFGKMIRETPIVAQESDPLLEWCERFMDPFEYLRDFMRAERVEIVDMGVARFGLRIIEPLRIPPSDGIFKTIERGRPAGVCCAGYMIVHTTPIAT